MKTSHRSTTMLCACALAFATASQAATDLYVKIEGARQGVFKGETVAKGRETWLEGISFGYEVVSPTDPVTGGATGKTQFGMVSFAKNWGASSPQLFQALSTNEALKTVVFEFLQPNSIKGTSEVFYRVTLTNARISRFRQALFLDAVTPMDSVSLAYQTITVESVTGNTSATADPRGTAARSAGSAFGLSYSVDKGNFKVELPDEDVELRFMDLQGALVKSVAARGGEVRFDARSLGVQPGMYLLQATIAGRSLGTVPVTIAK